MIIYRYHKNNKKDQFEIKDSKGNLIKDRKILEYVNNLVIPPAYKNVKIFMEKSPKILYEGYDDKGRKQQIYSSSWTKKAEQKKFKQLMIFGKMLPKIYLDINKNINSPVLSKDKIISLIIKIISVCYFRIGNLKYQKLYGSHGISNIQKKHLKIMPNKIEIKFIGKKGVLNECVINDSVLVKELTKIYNIRENPTDYIFLCNNVETKECSLIRAIDVNNWLKKYNKLFTTKMFRTFDTNTLLIDYLKKLHGKNLPNPTKIKITHRKKNIVSAMKEISQCVNNTPAICKKNYANNDLIEMYIQHPKKFEKEIMLNNTTSRVIFINFLKKKYKD